MLVEIWEPGTSIHYWWECNRYSHFKKQLDEFLFFFLLFSHNLGDKKSEIRVSAGLALKEDLLHPLLPASGGYGQFLTFFGLWLHHSSLPLGLYMALFSMSLCVLFSVWQFLKV